ncbi:hypothetical protein WN943_000863 [Citrus x changshan-huyou]
MVGGKGQLQTAFVTYREKFPGLFFILSFGYFETLQKELQLYDCVLYEMVASKGSLEKRRNSVDVNKFKSSRGFTF